MLQILHLEDNPLDAELIAANLLDGELEFDIRRVETRDGFVRAVQEKCFDLILADYSLPAFDGLSALDIARENCPDVPFIFISGALGEELAIETLKRGATDYVLKHRLERLVSAVTRALREADERLRARRAELALRESEERYRLIVEGVRDYAIFSLDTDGRITSWNPGAERLLGFAENEIIGEKSAIIFTPEDRASRAPEQELNGARENGRAQDRRWHQRKSGARFWADGIVEALYDEHGDGKTVTGFVKIMRDNTALHLAEEERRQLLTSEQTARRKAEEASRLKDEFLATVSHELRTPLNAIYGWSKILRSGRLDQSASENAVEIIERNARAQIQLIEDLLDVSRMITGKLRLEVVPVDAAAIIRDAIDAVRPAADAKAIRIETDFEPISGVVHADPNRLQQIVWNLLSNAVKFTASGGLVKIELRAVNSEIEICVRDTGAGISPEFLPFIFDRFRQAEEVTTRLHGGLGLGLAIVKSLIEMHGGRIWAESAGENQGSVFTVRMPQSAIAAAREELEIQSYNQSNQTIAATDGIAGLRILAVDDDEDSRELLKILLEQYSARVTTAASAREALARLESGEFDVLMSDVGMPGEDGYELIRKVRDLPAPAARTRAIALTGFARREDEQRALDAGFDAHVTKPIEPENLIQKIKSVLN